MSHRPFKVLPRAPLLIAISLLTSGLAPASTVLVLGDSLTAGLGIQRHEAFPALLEAKAKAQSLPATVINAGVSGDTSAGGLARINWVLSRKVDVLILALGANDGLRGIPPQTTAANLQAIISAAKKKFPDLKIIIAGMQLPPNLGAEHRRKFSAIFPKLAANNDALLVPFLLEGVGGVPHLNQQDRIHPTANGQKIIAANVWPVLAPLLQSP